MTAAENLYNAVLTSTMCCLEVVSVKFHAAARKLLTEERVLKYSYSNT